jgi:hypothetical protein
LLSEEGFDASRGDASRHSPGRPPQASKRRTLPNCHSTYLAGKSHSKLTRCLALRSPKFVIKTVCGVSWWDSLFAPFPQVARAVSTRGALKPPTGNEAIRFEQHASGWVGQKKLNRCAKEPDEVLIGERLSLACYIKDALPAALHLSWKYADDFSSGIIANARCGGDNCHSASVGGALLGFANGVPERWLNGGSPCI